MDRKTKAVRDRFRSNCTINALYRITGITYEYAEEIGRAAGWTPGHGIHSALIVLEANRRGIPLRHTPVYQRTVGAFIAANPRGRFFLRRRGHAMGLVDGKLFDNNAKTSMTCHIKSAWVLVLPC